MNRISVLIVDDEALLRQGLRSLLEKEDFILSIYEAGNTTEFYQQLGEHRIDLILLDIRLGQTNGAELLNNIRDHPAQPKVIAVTGLEGVEVMINLLKLGVNSIVYKLNGYNEIAIAIRATMSTGNYFPDPILKIIQANAKRWDSVPPVILTFQEKELLKAIASGLTTKEIATDFKMSPGTTETYRIRLMKKVGVSNASALLAYAYRNGIL